MNELTLIEESPSAGTRHPVTAGATIGREDCEIVLADPEVSRRHATIRAIDDALAIEDLGSTNGTFVNGERLTGVSRLKDGDLIKMANSSLRVEVQVDAGATRLRPTQPAPAAEEPAAAQPPPAPAPAPPQRPEPAPPTERAPAASPAAPTPVAEQATKFGSVRGEVPAPEPASASRVHQAINPTPAPPKHAFDPGGTGGTRRGSAATRVEATLVAYAIVVATAVAVILYVLAEKV